MSINSQPEIFSIRANNIENVMLAELVKIENENIGARTNDALRRCGGKGWNLAALYVWQYVTFTDMTAVMPYMSLSFPFHLHTKIGHKCGTGSASRTWAEFRRPHSRRTLKLDLDPSQDPDWPRRNLWSSRKIYFMTTYILNIYVCVDVYIFMTMPYCHEYFRYVWLP